MKSVPVETLSASGSHSSPGNLLLRHAFPLQMHAMAEDGLDIITLNTVTQKYQGNTNYIVDPYESIQLPEVCGHHKSSEQVLV